MSRSRLNVAMLRQRTAMALQATRLTPGEQPPSMLVSRRTALGAAGIAALTASPLAKAARALHPVSWHIERRGKALVVVAAGMDRWTIDPLWFDGATVQLHETDNVYTIVLSHAFAPGTTARLDFEATLSRSESPSIRITFPYLRTSLKGALVPWLLGRERLHGSCDAALILPTADATVEQAVRAMAMDTSWTFSFHGAGRVVIGDALSLPIVDSTLDVSPRSTSAFTTPPRRRSVITAYRGEAAWDVPITPSALPGWRVHATTDTFDSVRIETAALAMCAVLFESQADGLVTLDIPRLEARLPLRNVRYGFVRTTDGLHEAVVARFASVPTWLKADNIAFQVEDTADTPCVELVTLNGRIQRLHVTPALSRYVIPVDGAVVEPTVAARGTRLAVLVSSAPAAAMPAPSSMLAGIQIDKLTPPQQSLQSMQNTIPKDATKKIRPKRTGGKWGKDAISFPANPRITVIRPEDLLVLTFEFVGCTLDRRAGTFAAQSASSRVIVHFQPQHIAERAFFSADNPPKDTSSIPANAKKASSTETPLDPPIDAVMAHGSRLVFALPAGYAGKLTTKGLLDWSAWTQAVSPSAKPPASSFVMTILAGAGKAKFSGSAPSASKNTKATSFTLASKGVSNAKKYAVPPASDIANIVPAVAGQFEYNPDIATSIKPDVWQDLQAAEIAKPSIREPNDLETSIEYPYRLMLSPNKYAGWAHRDEPVWNPSNRRAELWHTRLGVRQGKNVSERAAYFRTLRAIWSPDYGTSRDLTAAFMERPFRTSLNRRDRSEIVDLTSNYGLSKTKTDPLDVKRFMLTSLGAWADFAGGWDPHADDRLDVEQWIQRGAQGRDTFVRVCYKGFLFPFGHRATLVKETERKFRRTPRGHMAAYLIQRLYIILREPLRTYPADGLAGMKYQGRDNPFRSVEITTKVTPNLELPIALTYPGGQLSMNSFWPMFSVGGPAQDVRWSCEATDWDGAKVQFSTPLVFLSNTDAANEPKLKDWIEKKYATGEFNRRRVTMGGQHIAYAPTAKRGDTTLPTDAMTFTSYYADTVKSGTPRFFPSMEVADTRIEKAQEILGTNATSAVKFYSKYLEHAFDPGTPGAAVANESLLRNPSQMFLTLLSPVGLDFGSNTDKAGGLAAPSLRIDALSRLTGPISAKLDDLKNSAAAIGSFDPMEYFKDFLETKILGDLKLIDLLKVIGNILNNLDSVPGLGKKDSIVPEDAKKALTEQAKDAKKAIEDAIKAADELKGELEKEVKDAKDALKAELQPYITELQNVVDDAKKGLQERLQKIRKDIEDRVTELRSEIEKTMKPLIDAGNEAYEKYQQAKSMLDALKQGIQLVYEWSTELKSDPLGLIAPLYPSASSDDQKMVLYLKAQLIKGMDLKPPEVLLFGSLRNFIVNLIGNGAAQFLIIKFNRLSISATLGKKPDIDPDIEAVEFAGPLSFVNKLKDLIPKGGSSGGVGFSFDFDVSPSGVSASLTIGLPNVTVGVFSLQNMAFLMRLTIPFDGRPFSAYFAFCTKENPFRLTIMVFGGGGFFGIEITPKGVKMLEAAFEFGGNFAFDCGVASGGASVMAGVYYKMEQKEVDGKTVDQAELTGYFRLTGNLSILGLIRVSLLFELKLTWQDNGKVYGTATIEVEIEILFISFSVGVTVERQLKGSDGDPTFTDMLPEPELWNRYCESFA